MSWKLKRRFRFQRHTEKYTRCCAACIKDLVLDESAFLFLSFHYSKKHQFLVHFFSSLFRFFYVFIIVSLTLTHKNEFQILFFSCDKFIKLFNFFPVWNKEKNNRSGIFPLSDEGVFGLIEIKMSFMLINKWKYKFVPS